MTTTQFSTAFQALSDAFRCLTEAHKTVIEEVKAGLIKSNKKVEEFAAQLPVDTPATPKWPRGPKRQRSLESPAKPVVPKSCIGTKVMSSKLPIIPKTGEAVNLHWMWLSSFPSSVTDDDIRAMVRECLSCDANEPIDVKMLVKKDADLTKLSAVNFKVGFDLKYREASMDGDTWSAGVAFREFIFMDREPTFNASPSGFSKNRRLI